MHKHTLSRRRFLAGLGAATGVMALSACAPAALPDSTAGETDAAAAPVAANELVEIDYWHRRGGDATVLLEDLAAEFNEQHAGQFSVTSIYQGSIQEVNQKVRAAAAGGGMPGALMADDYDVTQYYFSNILVPLDSYVEHPEYGFTQEQIDDILPSQFNRHKLDLYEGQMMALTQSFSGFATFWNVDALQKIGMERPPDSWNAFPDYARALTEANDGTPAWILKGAGDRFISCLLTYGVSWLKEGGEESNFDAPEALEIMTWWRELSDEGVLAVIQEAQDLFMAQENLHYMDSSASTTLFTSSISDFAWDGGMPPQRHENDTPITETYGPVNTIPKTSEEQQLAGWTWIKWLLEPEVHARYVQQSSYFPSTHSAVETELLQEFYSVNTVGRKLVDEIAPYAQILAPSPALPEVRGVITANVVQEVLLQQLSPEEGVQKLKVEADRAIRNAMM